MPVQQVHMHSWSLGRPEEDLDPPGLELPIMRVLGIDLESPEEQPVLLTAEPRVQLGQFLLTVNLRSLNTGRYSPGHVCEGVSRNNY